VETLKKLFDFGYGIDEFHRDLNPAIFALASWLMIRLPQIDHFTLDQFNSDLRYAGILILCKYLSSFVTNSKTPSIIDLSKQVEVNKEKIDAK